jgi:hypothetical protein
MEDNNLTKDLWQMSNIITGFAVIQAIAFTYACAKPNFSILINTFNTKLVILIHLFIVALGQSYALWWCADRSVRFYDIQENPNPNTVFIVKILWQAAWGRIFVVLILLIPEIISLYARQLGGLSFRL